MLILNPTIACVGRVTLGINFHSPKRYLLTFRSCCKDAIRTQTGQPEYRDFILYIAFEKRWSGKYKYPE